jgi:hypothetical protein
MARPTDILEARNAVRSAKRAGDLRWDGQVWLRWSGRRWAHALYSLRPDRLHHPAPFAEEDAVEPARRAKELALAVEDQVVTRAATVVHVGPTGTVLGYRRRPSHAGHAVMTLVTGGLWTPIWLIAASRPHEDRVRLEADRWGNVWGTHVADR